MSDDSRLDTILAALGQLTTVVGQLAETVAQSTANAASGPAPAQTDVSHIKLSTAHGYEPLCPRTPENQGRRVGLVLALGLMGSEGGVELLENGARGFFRKLERNEGMVHLDIPREIALAMIEDAALEDPREAEDMSHELLKVWEAGAPPAPGEDPLAVKVG